MPAVRLTCKSLAAPYGFDSYGICRPAPRIGRGAPSKAFRDYMEAYGINWDWLFYGSLKGLQRMMRERKYPGPKQRWLGVCRTLTPEQRQIIDEEVSACLRHARAGPHEAAPTIVQEAQPA